MTDVAIYLFARREIKGRSGFGSRWVRRITVDEAEWVDTEGYRIIRNLFDADLDCDPDDPDTDRCLFISGRITREC